MATFSTNVVTQAGQTLYTKVQSGTTLQFTRMQLGSGQLATSATLNEALTSGTAYTSLTVNALTGAIANGSTMTIGSDTVTTSAYAAPGATTISVNSYTPSANVSSGASITVTPNPAGLTALITPVSYFNINSTTTSGTTATIRGIFQNTSITQTTNVCEVGLFAQDPTAGEILYAYANAGTNGDNIPPYADGPYSAQYNFNEAIGNATSVTANIPAGTYVAESSIGAAGGVAGLDSNSLIEVANLPKATTAALGAVKVGTGIAVAADGTISTTPVSTATTTVAGTVETTQNPSGTPVVSTRVADQEAITLSSTSATTVATFTPTVNGFFDIACHFRLTASASVGIVVTYAGSQGALTTTILNTTAYTFASGGDNDYDTIPVTIRAVAGTAINVQFTASVASAVVASANILGR